MCGISGLVSEKGIDPDDLEMVRQVNRSLFHRGPDGDGEYTGSHISLAMRRLSIIDLTGGWQPLYNEDRSLVLIANGEIYNYIELRQRLQSRGHAFSTGSDCETILHLYEEYGLDCVNHLRGMFVFALWDCKRQRLVLARDRMGEKPLYLYEQDHQLLFASELRALMQSGAISFELDPEAVDLYFHYQYVPEPRTPIKGVRKLDAAHLLTVDVDPWRIEERCYWRMEDAPPLETKNPGALIREELDRVSEIVIRSDVPIGVALSGGLDSSAIAALAARKYPGTMHAFSVGYAGRPESDERADARRMADHLGLPFHEVELDTGLMVEHFPEVIYLRDDPIADISGYGYYAVMKLAREQNIPVMLQGQGGDELFWGYGWVKQAARESMQKQALGAKKLGALPKYLALDLADRSRPHGMARWARDFGGLRTGWRRYQDHRAAPQEQLVFYDIAPAFKISSDHATELYSQAFLEQIGQSKATSLFTFAQPWPRIDLRLTRLICDTYLRENGITQGDRLSMASSIELRLPLLDYKLVETVIGLRKAQTDMHLPAKAWLKEALRDTLPDWIMNRPKRGFTPPMRAWQDAIFASYGSRLLDGYLVESGILNPHSARQLAAGNNSEGGLAPLSLAALVLEMWSVRMSEISRKSMLDRHSVAYEGGSNEGDKTSIGARSARSA